MLMTTVPRPSARPTVTAISSSRRSGSSWTRTSRITSRRPWMRATGERSGVRGDGRRSPVGRLAPGCSSTARAAATTSGSNWVPDAASSSAIASSRGIARRYDRSLVIASNASQTAMIRAPSGIWSPSSPSGYPPPSTRSWVERTILATPRRAGADMRMDSPVTVWRRMTSHSALSSGPGLCRIELGITTLPMSCRSAARTMSSMASGSMARWLATERARSATQSEWGRSSGACWSTTARSRSRAWRLTETRWLSFCAYMRWSTMRRADDASRASRGRSANPHDERISACSSVSASRAWRMASSSSAGEPCLSTQNSSPPRRYAAPDPANVAASRAPSRARRASPAGWPCVSLYALNPSRSNIASTAGEWSVPSAIARSRSSSSACRRDSSTPLRMRRIQYRSSSAPPLPRAATSVQTRSTPIWCTKNICQVIGSIRSNMRNVRFAAESGAQARPQAVERGHLGAGREQVAAHRAVLLLERRQHLLHDDRGRVREHEPVSPLLLVGRPGDPARVALGEARLALGVVAADVADRHTGQPQHERGDQPGAVAAADAVDAHDAGRGVRDQAERNAEVGPEAVEEVEVRPAQVVRRLGSGHARLERLGVGVVPHAEDRHVGHLDGERVEHVLLELGRKAQVDDPRDAVVDERPCVAQPADVVRPHERPVARARSVLGGDAAEVADVLEPVPDERPRHLPDPRSGVRPRTSAVTRLLRPPGTVPRWKGDCPRSARDEFQAA